jgi:hypothetical protein
MKGWIFVSVAASLAVMFVMCMFAAMQTLATLDLERIEQM